MKILICCFALVFGACLATAEPASSAQSLTLAQAIDAVLARYPSLDAAQALIARRPAREVLRGFPRAVVELFTSGMTEAEFDLAYGRFTKPLADYQLYEVNGTDTAEIKAVNPAVADTQQMLIVG